MGIWLLVVMSAKTCQAFVAQVGFNWIDTSYQYVQSAVELLFVQDQRIVNVSLHQVLVMKRRFGQVCEFFQQDDSITSSAFGWLGDEGLAWILSQVMLKVAHLIRE